MKALVYHGAGKRAWEEKPRPTLVEPTDAIDLDDNRLKVAREFGATQTVNSGDGKAVEAHNVTITTRLVDTVTIPMLLRSVAAGRLKPRKLITHEFRLGELMKAYDAFGNAAQEKALKVILRA